MEKVLLIGAHFDDVDLACGGTAAKLVAQGKKVYKLTLTDNVTHFAAKGIEVDYESSSEASRHVCDALGITEIKEFKPLPCNGLSYNTAIMQQVEAIIIKYDIDTVFAHYPEDMNTDHVEASKIALTAARHCPNFLYYQSNAYSTLSPFSPTFFIDISAYIQAKITALSYYPSVHDRFGRLFKTNFEREHVFGFLNGTEYCEGFVPIRIVE